MKKSMPFSGSLEAERPRPPDVSFLLNRRKIWIMGVLNATPDSFYAASRGSWNAAERLILEGADLVDIGGESTRPGAAEVGLEEERKRILPVLEAVRERWPEIPISIDTQKAEVAREALARGADMINDISALRHDAAMADVVAEARCPVVLMHMLGTPQTMQLGPRYADVVSEVKQFFEERMAFAVRRGIAETCLILDPGIGFGKTLEHNLALLRRLKEFQTFGRPLLVGVSRKSFIGKLLNTCPPEERLEGSLAAALWAVLQGAQGLRVHDVGATKKALGVWEALDR